MGKFNSTTKVFGLGLSKTGTTSLGEALNLLGIKTIHYPCDKQTYQELSSGNYNLTISKTYQGIVDTPVATYYAQLDKIFPGSKFILTVREIESWLQSAKKHREVLGRRKGISPDRERFHDFIRAAVYGTLQFNEDRYRYVYETHTQNVLHYFENRPNDFLVMDICGGERWEKLCSFLDMPPVDVPFPHANQRTQFLLDSTKEIREMIPPGNAFILIDQEVFGDEIAMNRIRIPFMENEGSYFCLPSDGSEAITELDWLVTKYNPQHLIFAWPSFWWFDYYKDFSNYLRMNFRCLFSNERLVIFDLQSS